MPCDQHRNAAPVFTRGQGLSGPADGVQAVIRSANETMMPSGPRTYAIRHMPSYWPIPPTSPYPSAARPSTAAWRSSTSKATLRRPSSFAIATGDPGWCSGPTKNAVTRARSSTVMPTWSKRSTCAIAAILRCSSDRRLVQGRIRLHILDVPAASIMNFLLPAVR